MSAKEYSKIKSLLGAEVKASDIERLLGRNSATIGSIKKSSSFEDYKKIVRMYVDRQRAKKKQVIPVMPELGDADAPQEGDVADLDTISRKLSAIFDILQKTYALKLSTVEHAKANRRYYPNTTTPNVGGSGGFFNRFIGKTVADNPREQH